MTKGGTTISERIQFGENWSLFLELLDGERIREVARSEQVLEFYRRRSFILEKMTTVGGRHGCNEFVLRNAENT